MAGLRDIPVKFLKGVGPQRSRLLAEELGIESYHDLLHHFPSGYIDRSRFYHIRELSEDMPSVQIRGRFISFAEQGEGAKRRLVGLFSDGTALLQAVWFHRISAIKKAYNTGVEYILFGKPSVFNNQWSIVHPEVDMTTSAEATRGIRGIYPLTQRLSQRGIGSRQLSGWVGTVVDTMRAPAETLPADLISRHRFVSLGQALHDIHFPPSADSLQKARERLKFEELFYLQLDLRRHAMRRKSFTDGLRFGAAGRWLNAFYSDCLPFPLTGAQKRVVREIFDDMRSGRQMNRLLQGDVGSGKTLVALLCMLIAMGNGYQAALMAPTEILAGQHYESLRSMVARLGVNVGLLTGSTPARERRVIHEALADGSLHILVGTHALLEDPVRFKNLGLAVIDEQHRFGVAQRARLWTKNERPPHVLVMTATPIPRTLAMTVYGDLDVSVIDELPPGRKPVETSLRYEENRMDVYRSVGAQLRLGRQVYIVYPLIAESEKLDLRSVEEGYDTIREIFRDYRVAMVHGRLKPAEKDYQMHLFASGEARILVATTVIEVGVNVPNATVMIIENAERFGLSQLHQLRGRVGRGADKSYCVLMSKRKIAKETRQRLEVMTSTTDGFVVAEADMRMRGPGDIEGTMQSGLPMKLNIANLATDGQIIQIARDDAEAVLTADPELTSPAGRIMALELSRLSRRTADWSKIS